MSVVRSGTKAPKYEVHDSGDGDVDVIFVARATPSIDNHPVGVVMALTPDQIGALFAFVGDRDIELYQTWTASGGTHLYVNETSGDKREAHIARNGSVQVMS